MERLEGKKGAAYRLAPLGVEARSLERKEKDTANTVIERSKKVLDDLLQDVTRPKKRNRFEYRKIPTYDRGKVDIEKKGERSSPEAVPGGGSEMSAKKLHTVCLEGKVVAYSGSEKEDPITGRPW